jgi:hypothetical protein
VIAELLLDLLARVKTVPALSGSSSLTLGGKVDDATLQKILLPAAWVRFPKEVPDEQSYTHGSASGVVHEAQPMLAFYSVVIFVQYTTDDDFANVQVPLLETVRDTVHAEQPDIPGVFAWRYAGSHIVRVFQDRLAYEQVYAVDYSTQSP